MTTINSTNTPQLLSDGEYIAGKTGANPIVAQFVSGSGINIAFDNTNGNTTISCTSSGMSTVVVTGTTQQMAVNTQYIADSGGPSISFTLPTTAAVGSIIRVVGKTASFWNIDQNAGQTIRVGNLISTTGVAGFVQSLDQYGIVELICVTADTDFVCMAPQGYLNVN